jgi:hypothetical protein
LISLGVLKVRVPFGVTARPRIEPYQLHQTDFAALDFLLSLVGITVGLFRVLHHAQNESDDTIAVFQAWISSFPSIIIIKFDSASASVE